MVLAVELPVPDLEEVRMGVKERDGDCVAVMDIDGDIAGLAPRERVAVGDEVDC